MEELSATLQANMQDLQAAINRLTVKDATVADTKDEVMSAPEDVDLGRPGLGYSPRRRAACLRPRVALGGTALLPPM